MIDLGYIKCPKCQSFISKLATKCPKCLENLNKDEIFEIAKNDKLKNDSENVGCLFFFISFLFLLIGLRSSGFYNFYMLIVIIIVSILFSVYISKQYKKDNS